jgi:hypothetical protein
VKAAALAAQHGNGQIEAVIGMRRRYNRTPDSETGLMPGVRLQ